MNTVNATDQGCPLLPNGRLANLRDWDEAVAAELAQRDGIALTEQHWEVIHLMRDFYREYNIPPVRKLLKKLIAEHYESSKATDAHLDRLFPGDVELQGTRIAGLDIPLLDTELEPHRYATATFHGLEVTPLFEEREYGGEHYRFYRNGYLADRGAWDEQLAEHMANTEGLSLTPEHWEVIRFLRGFYFSYGVTPMVKLLINHMSMEYGPAKASHEYLYTLFPGGPSRQGSRIAGLPEPQGCVDP